MATGCELPPTADIVIGGAGLAGTSLALLLHAACPHWRVVLLEGGTEAPAPATVMATALAESARQILVHAGLWSSLQPFAAPITEIRVSHSGHPGSVRFFAREQRLEAYGQVIENPVLEAVLRAAVDRCDNIVRIALDAHRLRPRRLGMDVEAGGRHCAAALAVIADGADSPLRAALGIEAEHKDYRCSALLATLTLAADPGGTAWEHFTAAGPVALLPLLARDGAHRASLVWTLPPERARELATADPNTFLCALNANLGTRAGSVVAVGPRQVRPLRRVLAAEQVRSHLVLVGNAAHSLHPVAGQGFNLSLRDMATLTEVLVTAERRGRRLGDLGVLQQYLARQRADQARTIVFSDQLPQWFAGHGHSARLRAGIANCGLLALDTIPPLRAAFTRLGAGLWTREAQFAR